MKVGTKKSQRWTRNAIQQTKETYEIHRKEVGDQFYRKMIVTAPDGTVTEEDIPHARKLPEETHYEGKWKTCEICDKTVSKEPTCAECAEIIGPFYFTKRSAREYVRLKKEGGSRLRMKMLERRALTFAKPDDE